MNDQDLILIGRVIDGLEEARKIVGVLVSRGVLPATWSEIGSALQSIQTELEDLENGSVHEISYISSRT